MNDATVFAIVQNGRLQYEALAFVASFRAHNPDRRLVLMEPQPGPCWEYDPRIDTPEIRARLLELGAEIHPFENHHFGSRYPNGNKIEALGQLPCDGPFIFFDTDTVFMGSLAEVPFDFARPTASLRRINTWPKEGLYGPKLGEIWESLYARFDLDFASSQDVEWPVSHWRRYLYFNAGWFFGADAEGFGADFLDMALALEAELPKAAEAQELYPWLDQIVLPLVIHKHGGGRDTLPAGLLDGRITCHYRFLPLLYARESDAAIDAMVAAISPNRTKKLIKAYAPFKEYVFQKKGAKARALFDRANLPRDEAKIRQRLKNHKLWAR